jgi:hypothetical protein
LIGCSQGEASGTCASRRRWYHRGPSWPRDTVRSRLPDPSWLERWLDEQIRFDGERECKVSRMILENLSMLFGERLDSVQQLDRLRKTLAAA